MARFFLIFCILGISSFSFSAIITKIKGNECLIHLEDTPASVGDYFEALDLYGTPRGTVRIKKIKNQKAIASIVKGTIGINWILEQTKSASPSTASAYFNPKTSKRSFGVLTGVHYNRIEKQSGSSDRFQSLAGWGGGGGIFFNFKINEVLSAEAQAGSIYYSAESVSSFADESCRTRRCSVWIWWFPDLKALLKFNLPINNRVKVNFSGGLALSYWGQNDKNYDVFSAQDFNKIQPAGFFSAGADFHILGTAYYIPVSIGFNKTQMFAETFTRLFKNKTPKSSSVSFFSIQAGIAKYF